jgi:sodium/hydrogen antiporter
MSIVAHGMSAYPGASWYSRRAESFRDEAAAAEHRSVSEMPVRIRHAG